MIEVALKDIGKDYGADKVLSNFSLEIHSNERIGLIGRNGSGKTTLLKIIAGIEPYNEGALTLRKGLTFGYLEQIQRYDDDYRVIDVLNGAFQEINDIAEEIRVLEQRLAKEEGASLDKVLEKHGERLSLYEKKGGYEVEEKIDRICTGLKLDERFKNQKFNSLSGGEKTIAGLASILLRNPDLLLLDEPTNNLDLEAVEWLEGYLNHYKGSVLAVSHDRYFLNRAVTKIVELGEGEDAIYLGNFSYYVKEKERRLLEQFKDFNDQQKKIGAMREAIKRFRDWGTRADDERHFKKARHMEKRLEMMEKVERPVLEGKNIKLDFSSSKRSGKDVVTVKNVGKSFQRNSVLENADFRQHYGERVAVLGKNGSGKSTFIKLILGEFVPDRGEIVVGSAVKIGYLEQSIAFENEEETVLQVFRHRFPMFEDKARNILAKFLFFADHVFKKVSSLSGGERVRLKLCLLVHDDINFLILDEPTNHIDIESGEVLEEALEGFGGTVLFVSHDRYFINKLAGRVVETTEKRLLNYIGDYDYYKRKKAEQSARRSNAEAKKPDNQARDKQKARSDRKAEKQLKNLEKTIEKLETAIKEKEEELTKYSADHEKLIDISTAKQKLEAELEEKFEKWSAFPGNH